MKNILMLVFLAVLLVSCQSFPSTRPTAEESIPILLAAYSQDLSTHSISDDSLYSSAMKALLQERKLFYGEFFAMALHSDLVSISSSYDIRSIAEDANQGNTYIVQAAEVIHFYAKYRIEPGGHPLVNAANWAIAHTDRTDVKKSLQAFIAMHLTESRKNSTDGYETDFVVEHTFRVIYENGNYQLVEDSYTDANPQDNPNGTDVIEWQDGWFVRKKPDYTGYPDYSIYHTSIEELGKSLLNDYSK